MRSFSASRPLFVLGIALAVPLLTGADGAGCGPGQVVIGNDTGGAGGSGSNDCKPLPCPSSAQWDQALCACVEGGDGGALCPPGYTYQPATNSCVNPGGPGQTTSSSSSSSSSGAGGSPCQGPGTVDVVVGGQAAHFTANCASDTFNPTGVATAVGFLTEGGVAPGVSILHVYGCATTATGSAGLSLSVGDVTAAGTFTDGSVTYTGGLSNPGSLDVVVTKLGAVGDTIEGTLSGVLTAPPTELAIAITGTFSVCHSEDQLVP